MMFVRVQQVVMFDWVTVVLGDTNKYLCFVGRVVVVMFDRVRVTPVGFRGRGRVSRLCLVRRVNRPPHAHAHAHHVE